MVGREGGGFIREFFGSLAIGESHRTLRLEECAAFIRGVKKDIHHVRERSKVMPIECEVHQLTVDCEREG